jgi:uncharacterized protein YbjT (DUF2867 family)
MRVIITGATGMVGKGVLLECLGHENISEVLCISRRSLNMDHPKLKELIHDDFSEFASVAGKLKGYDAAFLCMGVSSAGMSEADYSRLTYDFTLSLAKVLHTNNPNLVLTYVSGQSTDSTEKGRVMWARVKGKTENDLIKMGFKGAYMYRPGAIIPLRGIKSSTKLYQFMYDYFMWFVKLMKFLFPKSVVNTTQIGLSMINIVELGYEKNIIDPADIQKLSEKASS